MQLPFNVSTRAHVEPRSRLSEPSLDRSTKRVMDDTDGDDEERPAQRVVNSSSKKLHVRLFFIGHTEVSMPWILALGDVHARDRRNAFVLA